MKTSIAAIAITLVCLVSFVAADHQMVNDMTATDVNPAKPGKGSFSMSVPVGVISNKLNAKNNTILVTNSNIVISLSDHVQLADIIKKILPNARKTGSAITMSTQDLFDILARIVTTPSVLSSAVGIISAAKSGDTGALAGHVVDLLRAVVPATNTKASVVAPTTAPLSTPTLSQAPAVTPADTPANLAIAMAPTYIRSTMSPPVALTAATTTST
ncbi:unnamed protein product [Peronospora farinosa]|uniref:FAS1 domain-containing protein n=1 Tax=Peronospora farinosa TaxID=134698 RepID=A0AAV0UU98_9STRA|nr:unnamed protein product [Peronospora farinosa]